MRAVGDWRYRCDSDRDFRGVSGPRGLWNMSELLAEKFPISVSQFCGPASLLQQGERSRACIQIDDLGSTHDFGPLEIGTCRLTLSEVKAILPALTDFVLNYNAVNAKTD